MDAEQSSQISCLSSKDLTSPKRTHTLTIRKYEQTIDELSKENFRLKMELHEICESRKSHKDKNVIVKDEIIQANLSPDVESLCAELRDKDKLLQGALERAEKLESDFNKLEKINADLQSQLASFSERSSKEELSLLLEEKEKLVNHTESLENVIKENEEEIDSLNQKIEILAAENMHLEEKIKKRSLAIQGFVLKNHEEKGMLPDEIKNIVISAIQAAKTKNEDDLVGAMKTFTSILNKIMSASEKTLNLSEEKTDIGNYSVEGLKEGFFEINASHTEQANELDSVHPPYIVEQTLTQNAVNIAGEDVIDFHNFSSVGEDLISFSETPPLQASSVTEHNLIDTENVSPSFYDLIPEKSPLRVDPVLNQLVPEKNTERVESVFETLVSFHCENKQIHHLDEIMEDSHNSREILKDLYEARTDVSKASQQNFASAQTEIAGCKLLDEHKISKLQKDAKFSDNVEELREDIWLLFSVIEEKDKELFDAKQSLAAIQEDFKKALNTTNMLDKDFYMHERNELHERLALSCSVNEELMKHLKNLEKFMEDLLQHKFDCSLESIADKSNLISGVSKCLNQSLQLSSLLSNHLSICEGSKLFEECESFVYKNGSYLTEKDLPYLGLNRLSIFEKQSSYLDSVSDCLFAGENAKTQDFDLNKFYVLISEKYNHLKSLLDDFESINEAKLSDDEWNSLNMLVITLGETLQKLRFLKENEKISPPSVCGKCVMLELFATLKTSQLDFCIDGSSSLHKILQEFSKELCPLKEACKDLFSLLDENASKKSILTQNGTLIENERIKELENVVNDLNAENKELNESLEKVKQLLSEEKKTLISIKMQNSNLLTEIDYLKRNLLDMQHKEKEFLLKNEKLIKELTQVTNNNSELNITLKNLEQKNRESSIALDQLKAEMQKNRLDLVHMSEKCSAHEKQLNDQIQLKEKYESELKMGESNSLNEKNCYLSQINDLNAEKDHYLQELKSVQEEKCLLVKEITAVNDTLHSKSNEILCLQKTVERLQKDKESVELNYKELQNELSNNRESLINLQDKYKKCEEVIIKLKETKTEYCQQLQQFETESTTEKKRLLNEMSILTKERDDILLELKNEKELHEKLKAESIELNEKCLVYLKQISTLKQKNKHLEDALFSSNKECDTLSNDLKCVKNKLQNLESKCILHEKELVTAASTKDSLVECLLNINKEFSVQRQKLNEMYKVHGNDDSVAWDETSLCKLTSVLDENNVSKLCENTVHETKKLSQSVDMLFSILKSHRKSRGTERTSEVKNQIRAQKKQKELHQTETETLHLQNDKFQHVIDELQKCVSEKENTIQYNVAEIQVLKEKLQNSQTEIDRVNQLIHRKDDEITMLQEKIFNLQMYMNNIITDRKNVLLKTTSMIDNIENYIFSNNQLPSKIVSTDTKICQTDEWEGIAQTVDDSFTSASSVEAEKKRCCEKYRKKCYFLQTNLALFQKRIDILEKDKSDLKEKLLQQLQNKKDSIESGDSAISKSAELESKLEKKRKFINEIKSELLTTCNALIEKEKEIDCLKQELAEYKDMYKFDTFATAKRHPITTLSSVDVNVKTLKKWELIQTIFDIQMQFYEKKGIHLNHFHKLKEHVNNLYSLQLTPSVSKSKSMPHLKTPASKEKCEEGNDKAKQLADLELDIECLENLKIFLNRLLVPYVSQMPESSKKDTEIKPNTVSSDRLSLPVEIESRKGFKQEITDILDLSFPGAFIITDNEKALSLELIASTISRHLDYLKKFLDVTTKKNWLEILDLSVEGPFHKTEVKSLLLQIFEEITILHSGTDKLFNYNAFLKKFESLAPQCSAELALSDRESVMSEEAIAISCTESSHSSEDIYPIRLSHPETLQLEENMIRHRSVRNKKSVIELHNTKTTVNDGSGDFVHERSHYSSPDLGIESDSNHENSAPEHKEQVFTLKSHLKSPFTLSESAKLSAPKFNEAFHAIGTLPDYELLKQEIKECLVAVKSILSRTGDGLHHIAKFTSPRKTLEYNTLKSIKDMCVHMEACLKEANDVVGKFWTALCPSEKEWKMLKEENENLSKELAYLKVVVEKQESKMKTTKGKLEHTQAVKDNMEKRISKKLVKTKKLIRQAELKLLETRCQNLPPVPKYPSEQTEQADTRHHTH